MTLRKCFIWFFLIIIGVFQSTVSARSLDVSISLSPTEKTMVKITGKISDAQKQWSFINSYADADNLATRISALKFFDEKGNEISFTNHDVGNFITATATANFSYQVKLDFPKKASQTAHISWLAQESGLLMLNDLLPDFGDEVLTGKVAFALETGWRIATNEKKDGENKYYAANTDNSVFLIGDFREQASQFGKTQLNLARAGEWSFSESEALDLAATILTAHQATLGNVPADKIQIIMIPLPQKFAGEQWEAETRGSTIILSSAQVFIKSRALSILHEQLRHELFHLWIPNNLNLSGDYAWFYEGFTLYQALKTGVRLKYIRFPDFLDAVSRAYDAARKNSSSKTLNLLDASRLRWRGDFSEFVYAKGMTAAFLCDLAVLQKSGGKKSLDDILKELYKRHQKTNVGAGANEAILKFLKNVPELRLIIEKYVETSQEIDWTEEINAAGLQNSSRISLTKLVVGGRINNRQKKALAELGYRMFEN